jgi:DNA invertase Pin-like site-specific DNA recombinase
MVAEQERDMISARTKAALAATKARGTKPGGYRGGPVVDGQLGAEDKRTKADQYAEMLAPVLEGPEQQGMTLAQMAQALTVQGIQTARGGKWTPSGVRAIRQRLGVR